MNPITFYQAAHLTDAEVKGQFVVRKKEFERVISEVRRDDMQGSIQHYVFVGQRGSGKSTLLRRIQAEIDTDDALSERLVAIYLSEEQAGIYRLHDLWDRVCQELKEKGFDIEEVKWESYGNDLTAFAKALYMAMQKSLIKKRKKLVLLLDNIDRIFESIKINDTHLFREQLINYKDVRIIGGSTRLSEHHWKYDQPFYEFSQTIPLEPMTEDELKELLIFWSDFLNEPALKRFVENNPGKLNAVRILSDVMPRTMLSLVELFINKPDQHGYDYLRYILDRATPVYQERLGTLPPSLQKVVLELSFFWDAAKVKDLSEAARIDSKTLSALLGQLVEMQIVEKIKGTGKNYLYRLKERFFNLWLIMTQGGPRQKSQVKWLTVFLETWYSASELKTIYATFSTQLAEGKITPDRAVVMTKALAHSKCLSIHERDNLLEQTKTLIGNRKEHLDFLPPKAKDVFKKVFELAENKRLDEAQKELDSIEQDGDEKTLLQGIIYHLNGNQTEAEKCYIHAIEIGSIGALNNLGALQSAKNELGKAEASYGEALEIRRKLSEANPEAYLPYVATTLNNLANLQSAKNELGKAEASYGEALGIYRKLSEANPEAYLPDVAMTLNNLGLLQRAKNELGKAEASYGEALEIRRKLSEANPEAYLPDVAMTLNNLGLLQRAKNELGKAEASYGEALEIRRKLSEANPEAYLPYVAMTLNNLANLQSAKNELGKAEKYYLMAIEKGDVNALYNLAGMLYSENQDAERAHTLIVQYNASDQKGNESTALEMIIDVWSGRPERLESADELLRKIVEANDVKNLEFFIKEILVHHQKNLVWQWFRHPEFGQTLKDMVKPLYHVTARFLSNKETEEELLAQAPELKETVDAIYNYIIERQQFYYGKGK